MTVKSVKEEGDKHYKDQNFEGAVQSYTLAINSLSESDPTTYVCYSNRSASYLQLNRFQDALSDANDCVRLKPSWPKGHNRRAACLVRMRRFDEAYAAYESTLQLEPDNKEAISALETLRMNSSGSTSNRSNRPSSSSTEGTAGGMFQNMTTLDWRAALNWATNYCTLLYFRFVDFWSSLSSDTQRYVQIGSALLIGYYFFVYRPSTYDYYPEYNYSSGYDGGYGYGGYGGGLSWTTWALVMGAAYKLPPLFPQLLGDYARPFFGMSWTTFMWLLNMLTGRGGGGGLMGGRGMFGGGRGGMFGRRRY